MARCGEFYCREPDTCAKTTISPGLKVVAWPVVSKLGDANVKVLKFGALAYGVKAKARSWVGDLL